MEELKINKYEAEDIENVLRLTHNIYRAKVTTGETNFDRQLQRATKFIRDVLATSKEPHPVENCGCTICNDWRTENEKRKKEMNCKIGDRVKSNKLVRGAVEEDEEGTVDNIIGYGIDIIMDSGAEIRVINSDFHKNFTVINENL